MKTLGLVLLAGFAVLIGCAGDGAGSGSERTGQEPGTFPGLDAETERQIMQARFDGHRKAEPNCWACEEGKDTIDSFRIFRYLGAYNGYVVIQFHYANTTVLWHEKIDGISFHDSCPPGITVWKDGVFYTMTELYEQGLLTREDLLTISAIHEELKEAYFEKLKQE